MNNSSSSSITALVPGGVVTTQNISTVIRPKDNSNSMQFVKIQTPELSKKAVEQIRVAQESKISKDKIKEVEEEWQNNLLNWKSKRRQQFTSNVYNDGEQDSNANDANGNGRKIKTFAEMIEQRAKAGNRLNFHLERYIASGDDEADEGREETDTEGESNSVALGSAQDTFNHRQHSTAELEKSNNNDDGNDADQQHRQILAPTQSSRVDSDYEAHSSLSSSYNQPNSKSPSSSLDSPAEMSNQAQKFIRAITPETVRKCDTSDLIHSPRQDSSHQISLVTSSEADRLNSTFKQEVKKPIDQQTISSNCKIKSIFDVDTETNEVSANVQKHDESDNSAYDEDDEDEEEHEEEREQKQLQRIAFEAKLNAFERMGKPSIREPKFVPARSTKAPPRPTLQAKPKITQTILNKATTITQNYLDQAKAPRTDQAKIGAQAQPTSPSSLASISPDLKSDDSTNCAPVVAPKASCETSGQPLGCNNNASSLSPLQKEPTIPQAAQRVGAQHSVRFDLNPSVSIQAARSPEIRSQVFEIESPTLSSRRTQIVDIHHKGGQAQNDEIDLARRVADMDLSCERGDRHQPSSGGANVIGLTPCDSDFDYETVTEPGPWPKRCPPPFQGNNNIIDRRLGLDKIQQDTQSPPSHLQQFSPPGTNNKQQQLAYNLITHHHKTAISLKDQSKQQVAQLNQTHVQPPPPPPPPLERQPVLAPSSMCLSPGNGGQHNYRSDNQMQLKQEPLPVTPPAQLQKRNHQQAANNPQRTSSKPNTQLPENKDRTVLSVSGKKRCSSCKEELGRGAAAFVVESLNLVYHTNCFRCSVCHVNLSNGFRGVDVRVHAGALHCQNCYSKDGLNYSRV